MEFECTKCGKCCRNPDLEIQVSKSDIDRWIENDLLIILAQLRLATFKDGTRSWIIQKCRDFAEVSKKLEALGLPEFQNLDLSTFEDSPACFFLTDENLCAIQMTKPRACRTFPFCRPDYPCPGIRTKSPDDDKTCQKIIEENTNDINQGVIFYSPKKLELILDNISKRRISKT